MHLLSVGFSPNFPLLLRFRRRKKQRDRQPNSLSLSFRAPDKNTVFVSTFVRSLQSVPSIARHSSNKDTRKEIIHIKFPFKAVFRVAQIIHMLSFNPPFRAMVPPIQFCSTRTLLPPPSAIYVEGKGDEWVLCLDRLNLCRARKNASPIRINI
jgi:hypothetical protein